MKKNSVKKKDKKTEPGKETPVSKGVTGKKQRSVEKMLKTRLRKSTTKKKRVLQAAAMRQKKEAIKMAAGAVRPEKKKKGEEERTIENDITNVRTNKGKGTSASGNATTEHRDNTKGHKHNTSASGKKSSDIGESLVADLSFVAGAEEAARLERQAERQYHGMSRSFRALFRKGKKIRKDAQPPSEKLIKAICTTIRLGNYPEVAVRAFGIRLSTFRDWVQKGFEDINNGDATPYALFVMAIDAADAQAEAQDIAAIRRGVENHQAIQWLRERKSYQRWASKSLQMSGNIEDMAGKAASAPALDPGVTSEVLAALEEAGIAAIQGQEENSGVPEVIDVSGKTVKEDGDVVVAIISD